ncbi:hypothetical protein ACO0SA_001151 [Hanseniaspora valbyensis]
MATSNRLLQSSYTNINDKRQQVHIQSRPPTSFKSSPSPPVSQQQQQNKNIESKKKDNGIKEFTQKAHLPQVTLRSTIVSLGIGTLVLVSNMQFGLQSGWITMMTLPSSLLACAIFKSVYPLLMRAIYGKDNHLTAFSDVENVYCQSVAVAVGTSALSFGFVGIVPAIEKFLTVEEAGGLDLSHLNYKQLVLWSSGLAFFGVFFAVPLRKQVVVKEKLPFPSGQSTAVLISVLNGNTPILQEISQGEMDQMRLNIENRENNNDVDEEEDEHNVIPPFGEDTNEATKLLEQELESEKDDSKLYSENINLLLITFSVSAIYTIFSYFIPQIKSIPVFGSYLSKHYLWNVQPSPAYFGQGIIMGHKTTAYMLFGALLGWGFLAYISYHFKYVKFGTNPNDWENGISGWVLWPSLTIMLVDSIIGLVVVTVKSFVKMVMKRQLKKNEDQDICHNFRASFFGTRSRDELPNLPLVYRPPNMTSSYGSSDIEMNNEDDLVFTEEEEEEEEEHIVCEANNISSKHVLKVKENGHTIIYVSREHNLDAIDPELLVSNTVTAIGVLLSFLLCVATFIFVFGGNVIPIYSYIIALLLSMFLSILAVRALGETDLNPVSGLGKLSQLIFSIITPKEKPGSILINLVAGAISEAGSQQAGDLMQDLKTGHLVGAAPKSQFIGMLIGTCYSIFLSSGLYMLYNKVYVIPSEEFRIPTALVWINSSRLFYGGGLPEGSVNCCIAVGLIFSIISLAKNLLVEWNRFKRAAWLIDCLPSGVAVGIAMIILPAFTIQRFIGGMFAFWYYKKEGSSRTRLIIVSSGLILGEGVCSVVNMILSSCNAPHL